MRFSVPLPFVAAFDETREMYHALVGGRASIEAFLEAVVAEADGTDDVLPEVLDMTPRLRLRSRREERLAAATENWTFLRRVGQHPDVFRRAAETLGEIEQFCGADAAGVCRHESSCTFPPARRSHGPSPLDDPDGQIRALVRLEDEIERRLGEVLAEMSESGVWRELAFSGAGQYGEERLGVSRSAAEGRARLAWKLRELPVLRAAYEEGRVGFEAACLIRRALDGARPDEEIQETWIEHASSTTVKRLRDEEILLRRKRAAAHLTTPGTPSDCPDHDCRSRDDDCGGQDEDCVSPGPPNLRPPTDECWQRSRQRKPGDAIERVKRYARSALETSCPDVRFHLNLPYQLASDLWTAIRAKKRELRMIVGGIDRESDVLRNARGSVLAAQMFSRSGMWIRDWAALLALLEDFLAVWDDPRAALRRRADAIYERDGWRCSAPGCTSQKNLEDHHLVYRSRGGGDELWNRICLCRFHHQQGEHGENALCHGRAPLGVVWSLGRGGAGGTWRNERKWNG